MQALNGTMPRPQAETVSRKQLTKMLAQVCPCSTLSFVLEINAVNTNAAKPAVHSHAAQYNASDKLTSYDYCTTANLLHCSHAVHCSLIAGMGKVGSEVHNNVPKPRPAEAHCNLSLVLEHIATNALSTTGD